MEILLSISLALIAGLMMSRLAKVLKLPAVTAYLVAGILIGPYCIGRLGLTGIGFADAASVERFKIITQVALGFIAFEIGNEFRLSELKQTGKAAVVIGILQALAATALVDISLVILHFIMPGKLSVSTAIILGAIATATAPAATLMVVKQYNAKGPLTDLLLAVVALDDAVGLVVFAVSLGIAKALISGSVSLVSIIVEPLLEIVLSLIVGAILGLLLTYFERCFLSRAKRTGLIVGFIILAVAISLSTFEIAGIRFGFSTLLMLMMMGTMFCNTCELSPNLMERADRWGSPLLITFFVLSGAELEFSVFKSGIVVLIGVIYIIARSLGKIFGAYGSCKLMKCSAPITKNLGITLLPQAGVALGMVSTVKESFGTASEQGSVITQVVLFSVLIYELVGPLLTRIALQDAGEITSMEPNNDRVMPTEQK